MKCPFCGSDDTVVKDSRTADDNTAIRRRRECPECGSRFTTFERVQLRELTVVKKNGEKTMFDRDKLARSIQIAVRKRPVNPERVEKIVNSIQRRLESSGLYRNVVSRYTILRWISPKLYAPYRPLSFEQSPGAEFNNLSTTG